MRLRLLTHYIAVAAPLSLLLSARDVLLTARLSLLQLECALAAWDQDETRVGKSAV